MALNTSINTPYLVLTGVVLIAIVFVFTVMQPQLDSITTLRHDITDNTNTLKTKQDFIASLSAKVQQLQSQPQAEQQLAVVVPQGDMTQDIVRVVSQYASQVGLVIVGVTNNSVAQQAQLDASIARGDVTSTPSDVRTLSFQVQTSGTYGQLRDFLKALEKSPRIIDVVHLSIKSMKDQTGQITATLDMQSYSQAQ
ncbi:MAG: type 4a pilus biogenesis protein PilO [Candidatus Andersenbacteria bacterium]|nr:type 4a pilus biogenesis protein PilO [Candidatus Andersenbacteria bacterium]